MYAMIKLNQMRSSKVRPMESKFMIFLVYISRFNVINEFVWVKNRRCTVVPNRNYVAKNKKKI